MMRINGVNARVRVAGVGCVLGGLAVAMMAAPTASAAPQDCSPGGVANTASSAWGSARQYLDNHPGANQVMMDAINRPGADTAANVRAYFTSHPNEYYDLRGILAPIGETKLQCNTTALPGGLSSEYDQFMAG
jgi:heme-binding protein